MQANLHIEQITSKARLVAQDGAFHYYYAPAETKNLAAQYDAYTFPKLSQYIQKYPLPKAIHTFIVIRENQILAMALLDINKKAQAATIFSLWVNPDFRQKKIGTKILSLSEQFAKTSGLKFIQINYRTYWKSTPVVNRILQRMSWNRGFIQNWYCMQPDVSSFFKQRWYQKAIDASTGDYDIELWNDQSMKELKLLMQSGLIQIAPYLNPLQLENQVAPHASFLVKKGQELSGWFIAHQIKKELWQVSTWYLRREVPAGIGVKLVAMAAKAHNQPHFKRVNFIIDGANQKMFLFAKRHLQPGSDLEIFENRIVGKQLK